MFLEDRIIEKGRTYPTVDKVSASQAPEIVAGFMGFVYDDLEYELAGLTGKDAVVPTIKRYTSTFKKAIKVLEDENRCYVNNNAFEVIVRHFNPHLNEAFDKYKVF